MKDRHTTTHHWWNGPKYSDDSIMYNIQTSLGYIRSRDDIILDKESEARDL